MLQQGHAQVSCAASQPQKNNRNPRLPTFSGPDAVCDVAWVLKKATRGIYVLAYGVRVSDHTEVSLWSCHGHCDVRISTYQSP